MSGIGRPWQGSMRKISYFHILFLSKILQPQIIEGWAKHDSLSRSRLYIFLILRRLLCLFGPGFTLNIKHCRKNVVGVNA